MLNEDAMKKIKDIMTKEVYVLHDDQNLAMVRSLMQARHIRHIPIVSRQRWDHSHNRFPVHHG